MSEKAALDIDRIKLQVSTSPELKLNYETNSFISLSNYDSNNNQLDKNETFHNKITNLSESNDTLTPSSSTYQINNKDKIYCKSLKKNEDLKTNSKVKLTSHSNSDLGYNNVFLPTDLYDATTPQENSIKKSDTYQSSKPNSKKQLKQLSTFSLGSNSQKSSNWSRLKSR